MKNLIYKKVLYIICGGISAYKSLETIRLFKKNGAQIKTILTNSAKEFITPLSVASLSQGKVYSDLFDVERDGTERGVINCLALLVKIVFICAPFFLKSLIVSRLL